MKKKSAEKNDTPVSSLTSGAPLNLPPDRPETLRDVLEQAVARKSQGGLVFVTDTGAEQDVGLDTLFQEASALLAGLQQKGMQAGDHLILQLDDKYDFLRVFWACILGGIIPAPIAPTLSLDPDHKTFTTFRRIYQLLEAPLLVLDHIPEGLTETLADDDVIQTVGHGKSSLCVLDDLRVDHVQAQLHSSEPDDLAFLQFTSGSTGNPKGVMLTHANLVSNIHSIVEGAGFSARDKGISWMPLYHDMGLIGGHLAMILSDTRMWHMRPFTFIKRPLLWLKKIDEHHLTATVSPNFGYKWVLEKVKDEQLSVLDLSSMRLIFNGAEPISMSVMDHFQEKLGVLCGLDSRAMFPVYGMAEASLAVTFPSPEELPRHSSLSRLSLGVGDTVRYVDKSARDAVLMAEEGGPVAGVDLRIMDDEDRLLNERQIGHIQIRGENVTSGYYRNLEATDESFCDGWLRTGDLGFVSDQNLTITGRAKDIIFINGQNFYAHDLEEIVAHHKSVDNNGIAVVAYRDEYSDEERVVLFMTLARSYADTGGNDILKSAKSLILEIGQELNEIFGFYPHFVSIIKRNDIPKTSSGKIQRYKLLNRFHQGDFDNTTLYYLTLLAGPRLQTTADQQQEAVRTDKLAEFLGRELPSLEKCEDMLRMLWADALGIPAHRIHRDHSFAELGGTSIKAIEIIGRMEDRLNCQIPQHIMARANSIAAIVGYIHDHKDDLLCDPCALSCSIQSYGKHHGNDDIAVIGMSCRFPGAENVDEFWENLSNGVDSVTEIPRERWDIRAHYSRSGSEKNKSCSKWGGFLNDIRHFDAEFFNIQPDEADHLDPQQRLFLEIAWETLASGGYTNGGLKQTGVFVGASFIGYTEEIIRADGRITIRPSTATGNLLNMIAARVSHFFDLKGPAMAVDTACSSSLAAIHLACQSLQTGECDMALAGGISLNLSETPYIFFSEAGALSPDGVCRVFDEDANGFVPGEGAGGVLLKTYRRARADGDTILAVIKGSAMNNDGHSMGLMAPNPHSQADVIRQAYINSGVSPETVSYLEAHGTATQIGDSIEVRSLSQVFRGAKKQQCAIGSVKSNIGHLLAASGIAGLIKVILCLQHQRLVPSLHCRQEKKGIKFEETPFFVGKTEQSWKPPVTGTPLTAGINSFGFGGTNCHLIIQEASSAPIAWEEAGEFHDSLLITLSAHHPDALQQKIKYLRNLLHGSPESSLRDISYTLNARKSHFPHYRLAIVTDTTKKCLEQLETFSVNEEPALLRKQDVYYGVGKGGSSKVVFMFSGQGAQFPGMGKLLYEREVVFRETVDLCHELMAPSFEYNIVELICDGLTQEELNQTALTQPVTFVMDLALAMFWINLGLKPAAVLGHSVGEYVAAVVAGVIALEDGLRMAIVRGRLMAQLPEGGGMAAVFAPREDVLSILQDDDYSLEPAGFNGPDNVVLSGETEELERFLETLRLRGINSFRLQVSHAFHSRLMEPMLEQFAEEIADVTFHPPGIPFVSNLTGNFVSEHEIDHNYWLRHIRSPVQFVDSIATLCKKGYLHFLEAGGQDQLKVLTSRMIPVNGRAYASLPNPRKNPDQIGHLAGTMAELYSRGFIADWGMYYMDKPVRRVVSFPNYPFQRQEFWLQQDQAAYPFESMIRQRGAAVFSILENMNPPLLAEHLLDKREIMPAGGQCELVLSCFIRAYGYSANRIRSLVLSGPWYGDMLVDILFEEKGGDKSFKIVTGNRRRTSDLAPDMFSSGIVDVIEPQTPEEIDIEGIIGRCPRVFEPGKIYARFKEAGLNYGPYFQNLRKVHGGSNEALAEISLDTATSADAVCVLHPGLLESALQAVGCCGGDETRVFLPLAIKEIIIHRRPMLTGTFAHIRRLSSRNNDLICFDLDIVDRLGKVCVEIKHFSVMDIHDRPESGESFLFQLDWQEQKISVKTEPTAAGSWLIVPPDTAVGSHLKEQLLGNDQSVVDAAEWVDNFDGDTEESYHQLFSKLAADAVELSGIIYCGECTLTGSQTGPVDLQELSSSVRPLFFLFQALSRSPFHHLSFFRISVNGQTVLDGDTLADFGRSLSSGFLRSMAREMGGMHIRSIDFSAEHSSSVIASLIMEEMTARDSLEAAYRAGRRYVNSLSPWLPSEQAVAGIQLVRDHVYWIIGGLQGVGAETALHLAMQGATRLVISGRTPLPPAEQYDAVLQGEDLPLIAKIKVLRRLEEAGCQVLYLAGDVADNQSMHEQYNRIKQQWGAIHGVIHSALHLEDAFISGKSWDSFERVLAPRVWGTILLDRLTREEPLEFFILFSSLAGVIGNIGQGDYAAASCFMDHFVTEGGRQGSGTRRSVQWGQWSLGRQVSPVVRDFMNRYTLRSIRVDEGMAAFDTILSQKASSALAFVPHLAETASAGATLLNGIREGSDGVKRAVPVPDTERREERRSVENPPQKQKQERRSELSLEQYLLILAAGKFEMAAEDLDPDMNFLELGADSMMAIQIVRDLETVLKVELYPTLLFEYPSINELAAYLHTLLPDSLSLANPAMVDRDTESRKDTAAEAREVTEGNDLFNYITSLAAAKLELDRNDLDPDMNFLELGADSMVAIAIIREVEKDLDIELYPTLLFEYPTINDFLGYLESTIPDDTVIPNRKARVSDHIQEAAVAPDPVVQQRSVDLEQTNLKGHNAAPETVQSTDSLIQILTKQQEWFEEQFKVQRQEIADLRQLLDAQQAGDGDKK